MHLQALYVTWSAKLCIFSVEIYLKKNWCTGELPSHQCSGEMISPVFHRCTSVKYRTLFLIVFLSHEFPWLGMSQNHNHYINTECWKRNRAIPASIHKSSVVSKCEMWSVVVFWYIKMASNNIYPKGGPVSLFQKVTYNIKEEAHWRHQQKGGLEMWKHVKQAFNTYQTEFPLLHLRSSKYEWFTKQSWLNLPNKSFEMRQILSKIELT